MIPCLFHPIQVLLGGRLIPIPIPDHYHVSLHIPLILLFILESAIVYFFYPIRMLITVLLTLTDDKILVQMGALREGQTDDEKEIYNDGLKAMINEMRLDKVKDFNIVAKEIAAYRRRFLQDPSRVLPL